MRTAVSGMPRIGEYRALKWALERFWRGETSAAELETAALAIRQRNWQTMATAGVDFIPSNDFSLYDHVLDAIVMVGAAPARFRATDAPITLDRYFAMARGADIEGRPVAPAGPHQVVRHQLSPPCARDRARDRLPFGRHQALP